MGSFWKIFPPFSGAAGLFSLNLSPRFLIFLVYKWEKRTGNWFSPLYIKRYKRNNGFFLIKKMYSCILKLTLSKGGFLNKLHVDVISSYLRNYGGNASVFLGVRYWLPPTDANPADLSQYLVIFSDISERSNDYSDTPNFRRGRCGWSCFSFCRSLIINQQCVIYIYIYIYIGVFWQSGDPGKI